MKDGKLVTYWDADIFITILEGDKKDQDLFDGAVYAKDRVEKKECYLVISQLINIEITNTIIPADISQKFNDVLKRSNVIKVSMGNRVSNLATDLIKACKIIGRVLKPPDSIHLATALLYDVDEFYTNDEKLLKLNEILTIPKYKIPLIIRPPLPKQITLNLKDK